MQDSLTNFFYIKLFMKKAQPHSLIAKLKQIFEQTFTYLKTFDNVGSNWSIN